MTAVIEDKNDNIINNLLDDFYKYMQSCNEAKDEGGYYSNGIHCSSLGACKRKVIMEYFNFPKLPYNLPTLLQFEGGNHIHHVVRKWINSSDRFEILHEEFDVSKGLPEPIVGRCDLVFKDKLTNEIVLADTKSAAAKQFTHFKDSLPKDNHIIQLTAYGYGLKQLGINYDKMCIMYFDRGGANKPLIYFVKEYADIEGLMNEYILAWLRHDQDKILPPKLTDKKDFWQCSYCSFMGISCEGYIEQENEFSTWVTEENKKEQKRKK